MTKYSITTAITGSAFGEIEADSEDEALKKFRSGEVEMQIDDWDTCVDPSRGGFVGVEVLDQ